MTVDPVRGEPVYATVMLGGVLSNNKGINKQGGGLTAPALTANVLVSPQYMRTFARSPSTRPISISHSTTFPSSPHQLKLEQSADWPNSLGSLASKIPRATFPQC